mgnify:CR=1 FL=1
MELRSSARTGTSSLTSIWLEKDNFTELENFYETFKEKENVSQRRKDQMKMLHFLCKLRQGEEKV